LKAARTGRDSRLGMRACHGSLPWRLLPHSLRLDGRRSNVPAVAGSSADAEPKAWPQRPEGQRCWFAGKKTAFARAAARPMTGGKPASKPKSEWDFQNDDPIWQQQPWSVEHRGPSY
jgi:hypothetical protein